MKSMSDVGDQIGGTGPEHGRLPGDGGQAITVLDREHADILELFERVSDPEADRGKVLRNLLAQMATHVAVEQAVFYPVVRHLDIVDADALDDDYRQLGHLLVLIERRKANSPDVPDMVNELMARFESHCRRFSHPLGENLQAAITPDELAEMEAKLQSSERVIVSHPHPHLLSLGRISPVTTRLAAVFDRARDRTVNNRTLATEVPRFPRSRGRRSQG